MPQVASNAKKPRPPGRDYSHRALLDTLGVKPEHRIAVLGVTDDAFLKDLVSRVPNFSRENAPSDADLILFGAEDMKAFERLKSLSRAIQKHGAL